MNSLLGECGEYARGVAIGLIAAAGVATSPAAAAEWSVTEVQFQYGSLDVPTFATGGKKNVTQNTAIITLQHASGWAFGVNQKLNDTIAA